MNFHRKLLFVPSLAARRILAPMCDPNSTRVGIAAVRNPGRRILGSASTRNPHTLGTVSAQNIGHSNRGISIHIRMAHNNLGRHGG